MNVTKIKIMDFILYNFYTATCWWKGSWYYMDLYHGPGKKKRTPHIVISLCRSVCTYYWKEY